MFFQSFALDVLAVISFLSVPPALADQPLVIPYNSDSTVGPDGPWNFIRFPVGKDSSSLVDFHPMIGNPASLMTTDDCSSTSCISPSPQYYSGKISSTDPYGAQLDTEDNTSIDTYDQGRGWIFSESGTGQFWRDTFASPVNIDHITMFVSSNAKVTVGSKSYKPISQLSLENNDYINGLKDTSGQSVNSTTPMQGNFWTGAAGSFGLHPGQAVVGQPGSLTFGGYDSNRLIEQPMTMQPYLDYPLNSISFGTAKGDSPWRNVTLTPNFLGELNMTDKVDYRLSPHLPYLYLPSTVCSQMAQFLPITFDPDTNLYLWNTSDPQYADIVSSPSYMNFTFNATPRGSIRVPFAALDMTLTAPLKDKPTRYFPCYPSDTHLLGRAFMQSAFFMHAWGSKSGLYYLAQAPGPSVGKTTKMVALPQDNPVLTLPSNPPSWYDTWKDVVTPLNASAKAGPSIGSTGSTGTSNSNGNGNGNDPSSTSSSAATTSPDGLSTGAKAGVAVAVILGISAALIGAMSYLNYRRRRALRAQGQDAVNVRTFGFGFWRNKPQGKTANEADSITLVEKDVDAKSFAPSYASRPGTGNLSAGNPGAGYRYEGGAEAHMLHGRSRSELTGSAAGHGVVHEVGGDYAAELPAAGRC